MNEPQAVPKVTASGARPDLTPEQCMRLWIDLMETTDQLLRSGLQATLAEGEDFDQRYLQWHEEKAREHDAMMANMLLRLQEAEDRNAS
jgi:hypothetical protein